MKKQENVSYMRTVQSELWLISSAARGDTAEVRRLLAEGAEVNYASRNV